MKNNISKKQVFHYDNAKDLSRYLTIANLLTSLFFFMHHTYDMKGQLSDVLGSSYIASIGSKSNIYKTLDEKFNNLSTFSKHASFGSNAFTVSLE